MVRCHFCGLGADGTVGANKNSIKIIGEDTPNFAQGYFVYDSKKSGSVTVSHLRFGPSQIRSSYLVSRANFVACHQFGFLEKYEMLDAADPGAVFLLNTPYPPEEIWDHLPLEVQKEILAKKLRFYVIDAVKVAKETGMGGRINTIMQTCFFAISGVLPRDRAIELIKKAIEKSYGRKGAEVVRKNFEAVDQTLQNLHQVDLAGKQANGEPRPPFVSEKAPDFVKKVTALMLAGKGDLLPVSAFPVDGTWPSGTAKWEKRAIALEIPTWDSSILHPVQQVRAHLSARRHPSEVLSADGARRRAEHVQVDGLPLHRLQGDEVHASRWRRRTAPAAASASSSAPPSRRPRRATRPSTWRPWPRCARRSAGTSTSSSSFPRPTGPR